MWDNIVKPVNYSDIDDSVDVYYFGWLPDELAIHRKQYQSKYFGGVNDGRFEIIDNEGSIYYAIFKSPAEDEWIANKPKGCLLFNDQNRVLFNIDGKLYRYLINERKILDDVYKNEIIQNHVGKIHSPFFTSVASGNEIMVVTDHDGFAAINWEGVLWKKYFNQMEFLLDPYLDFELLSVDDNCVFATCYIHGTGDYQPISFYLSSGEMIL